MRNFSWRSDCVLNRSRGSLDFVPGGTSFLDITLTSERVVAPCWFYPSIPSLSDHPYINFEVAYGATARRRELSAASVRIPDASRVDGPRFCYAVTSAMGASVPELATAADIESAISDLAGVICVAARGTRARRAAEPQRRMPWWSVELCALRNRARGAFRLWSGQRSDLNRAGYVAAKAAYQRELRCAKRRPLGLYLERRAVLRSRQLLSLRLPSSRILPSYSAMRRPTSSRQSLLLHRSSWQRLTLPCVTCGGMWTRSLLPYGFVSYWQRPAL